MSNTLAPSVSHRDPKGRKFITIVEQAYDKAGLSEDEAQRVNETAGLATLLAEFIARARLRQDFAGEEVASRYGYLSGYRAPKPIADQMATLKRHFPELHSCDEQVASGAVPAGAEGWFAIPRWQALGETYGEALERVLEVLSTTRHGKFVNYRKGQLGPDRLRQSVKKAEAIERIASTQEGHDVLVIAGQFGIRHRGRSVRRARAVMEPVEVGMGAFEVAIMLLTHPERLAHYDDLWIDCAGDEYSWDADGHFGSAPFFLFDDGYLEFGTRAVVHPHVGYGSASGFLLQAA